MSIFNALQSKICMGLGALLLTSAVQANLIENGGFETPDISQVVGKRGNTSSTWQYFDDSDVAGFSGSNIEIWNSGFLGVDAYEGNQFMELNSHPSQGSAFSIFQTFDTAVGETYEFSFAYRARRSHNEAFSVDFNSGGSSVFNQTMDDHKRGFWSFFSGLFTAEASSTTLTFTSVFPERRTVGNFIDDVRVQSAAKVPEIDASNAGIAVALLLGLIALIRERFTKQD